MITIIGYGKMAKAIACGLNGKFELEIAGRDEYKIQDFIKENSLKNTSISHIESQFNVKDKIIIMAIKPYALESFKYKDKAHSVFSLMAGISIAQLKNVIDSTSYCRVMPNIASLLGAGVSAIYAQDEESKKLAKEIFDTLGMSVFVDKEVLINSAGALSGSGPAYLGIIAEALIDAGVREGLSLDTSKQLVKGLFNGFSKLLAIKDPNEIKLDTTSPGGTTAEAIQILEARAIRGILMDAVHSANIKANNML
ncbi:pyrroline-5-carboxylate reductase [Helicobacter sp. 16-1353]|uniref:pyrroline-5-carboxylate reductase n=1 Tax=Helicobacter sp. 16-1353 TaxID=2004996 RepID=UPI000DCE1DE0|nr:pyrroline-5-carboxylate reductase [Helicobacter sp. 16-1353]RAX55289.1 pyrroline-5-carboxylate reductase [Helicobacter sp. 16-1353]